MRSTVLILFLLSMISACGKPASSRTKKDQSLDPKAMSALINAQNIFCSDAEFCPEGVARLFTINFLDNAKSSECSGFLVAEDLVMTNSHCVWAGKISLEKTCEGMYFAFPTPHGQTQTASCSKILWRDNRPNGREFYTKGDNDFALIRLDRKVPIKPLKLNPKLAIGQVVHPLVIDHMDEWIARVTKLDCVVKSIDRFGVAILQNCPIISGNSGAAVVDANKKVVAIIFASSNRHVRNPTDEISIRRGKTKTTGSAMTISHIQNVLGKKLSLPLQD